MGQRLHGGLLACAAALPIFALAATRGLWAPDEPRRAEVARELFESGDLLVLHLCGAPYPDKPPLFFWLAGALGRISGWSELAMRLVPLGATLLTAWITARWARRAFGELEAAFAPALLLSSAMLLEQGQQLQIDPLLMACTTAALYLLAAPAADPASRSRAWILAGLATGLGALAKGPIAFVLVGLPLAAWKAWERWAGGERQPGPSASAGAGALALALAVGPVLVWATAVVAREPELGRELFWAQHAGRIGGDAHLGPPWKSAARLPLLWLPWSALAASGLAAAWRARAARGERELVRAALWLATLVVFFSAIPTKRDLYLLPAYPALALLSAHALGRAARGARRVPRAWWATAALAFGALVLAGIAAGPLASRFAGELEGIEPRAIAWRGAVAAACALAALLAGLGARASPQAWARVQVLGWSATALAAGLLFTPLADPLKSSEGLARWLAARPEKPSAIPCVAVKPEGYRFYGGVPAVAARGAELAQHLDREGPEFLALVRREHWASLAPDLRARTSILREARVGGREILVLGRSPPAPPSQ